MTLEDLSEREIVVRADYYTKAFVWLKGEIQAFVAAGCPVGADDELLIHMNFYLDKYVRGFTGARDWLDSREEFLRATIAELNVSLPKPKDVPLQLVAGLSCEKLFIAEEAFFATLRKHTKVLKACDRRDAKTRRRVAH